ncbi:MAG: DMT family transporter [Leptolyngbyaceae cyanobacterium]
MLRSTSALIIGFVLLWNSGFIGAEYGLPYAPPFTLLFWRYWVLTLVLFAYLAYQRQLRWPPDKQARQAILTGILAHGVWLSCVLVAIQQDVPAGVVALVVALQPLATGAFSGLVVGEYPRLSQWLGLIIAFGGVALIVLVRMDLSNISSDLAYLLPLVSVIAITIASLIQRAAAVHQTRPQLPLDQLMFWQCLGTAVWVSFPAIVNEKLATEWNWAFTGALLWLIFVVSLGAYSLMWLLIKRLDATKVASLFYLGPPVTMIMAWAAFGDVPQPIDYVGMVIVAGGVVLAQR